MNPRTSPIALALTPLGGLYGIVMKARRALYSAGRLPVHQLGAAVISVGNLTTGGTGKTPLVEWIAGEFARKGRRVCILTRGYGRRNAGARVIVSDGNQILSDSESTGDEPLLLAERLQGSAAVICDTDRVAAARWARENFKSDVFILDDGFQHLRVARDLNILTIDATNPWGNGQLLPAGILRESRSELVRADCVVITRADDLIATKALRQEIAAQAGDGPIFVSRMNLRGLRPVASESQALITDEKDLGSPVAAFCGIGNPESFFSLLRRRGYQLCHTEVFRDHHRYTQSDINHIEARSTTHGAGILLTTAKYEVKLRSLKFELPCYAAGIAIEIDQQDEFRTLIEAAIRKTTS